MPNKDTQKPKETQTQTPSQRSFNSGYTVGLNLLSSVVVGMALGYGIDHYFETKPVFFLVFMVLGIAAGFRSIWYFINAQPPARPPQNTPQTPHEK